MRALRLGGLAAAALALAALPAMAQGGACRLALAIALDVSSSALRGDTPQQRDDGPSDEPTEGTVEGLRAR